MEKVTNVVFNPAHRVVVAAVDQAVDCSSFRVDDGARGVELFLLREWLSKCIDTVLVQFEYTWMKLNCTVGGFWKKFRPSIFE